MPHNRAAKHWGLILSWLMVGAFAQAEEERLPILPPSSNGGAAGQEQPAPDVVRLEPGQTLRIGRGGAVHVRGGPQGQPASCYGTGWDGCDYVPARIYPDDVIFYGGQQYGRFLAEGNRAGRDIGRREALFRGALDMYNERMGNPPASPTAPGAAFGLSSAYLPPPSWDAYYSGRRAGEYEAELWLARDRNLIRTARAYTEKGRTLFRAGNYDGAADAFRLAASSDHGDAVSRLLAGHACFAIGKHSLALSYIRRAFQLQPKIAMLDYGLHAEYGKPADFDEHVERLRKAAEARPDSYELWTLLGYVYRYSGNRKAGEEALTRAYRIEPRDRLVRILLDVDPDPKK